MLRCFTSDSLHFSLLHFQYLSKDKFVIITREFSRITQTLREYTENHYVYGTSIKTIELMQDNIPSHLSPGITILIMECLEKCYLKLNVLLFRDEQYLMDITIDNSTSHMKTFGKSEIYSHRFLWRMFLSYILMIYSMQKQKLCVTQAVLKELKYLIITITIIRTRLILKLWNVIVPASFLNQSMFGNYWRWIHWIIWTTRKVKCWRLFLLNELLKFTRIRFSINIIGLYVISFNENPIIVFFFHTGTLFTNLAIWWRSISKILSATSVVRLS